jgi:chromosome segregation ATPase
VQLQRELANAVERKRVIFDDIDKENLDYAYKALEKVNEKDSIRIQICEVENILRMLRAEVEQTTSKA